MPDKWEKLAEILCGIAPDLQARIDLIHARPPDPLTQPVSAAIAQAYVSRLEIQVDTFRRGAEGLKDEYHNHPNLMNEIQELETWILRKTTEQGGAELIAEHKDELGDWLCSVMGYSYSKARQMLDSFPRSKRGAPSKRPETLKMMDARIANGWSYPQLAANMCDCAKATHDQHCSETIRKRLKELETFLASLGIPIPEKRPR